MKLTALSLGILLISTGCARSAPVVSENQAGPSTVMSSSESPRIDAGAASPAAEALQASFSEISSSIMGDVGVAVAGASEVRHFGTWREGPAWSTVKVPLAIAALRKSEQQAAPLVPRAIRDSDNTAAEQLWAQLGEPKKAADEVAAVLREGGDESTEVESERKRKDFTVFGQTTWSLSNQATFMATLPCLAKSGPVIADMHNLAANQHWGLALRTDTPAKGGWGPSPEGAYLVRQIATVTTDDGNIGIALSALPRDGKFDTGVAQVGTLAKWVEKHLSEFAAKKCAN